MGSDQVSTYCYISSIILWQYVETEDEPEQRKDRIDHSPAIQFSKHIVLWGSRHQKMGRSTHMAALRFVYEKDHLTEFY